MDFVGNNQIIVHTTRSNEGMNASNDHQQLKRFPGENPDDDELDCTLKLGLPYNPPEQVPTINQMPTPTAMPTSNMYYGSSQVLNNYGVVNGTGVAYSTRFPWIPRMMNPDNNMGGFGFYGGLSMAFPSSSYPCNNYGQYLGFYKPQNNVPVSNIIQRRAEPEPSTDSIHDCFVCKTTTIPLWRNGPNGPKTLCNACGIRYKKEEKRIMKVRTTEANVSNPHKKPKN